MEWNKWNEWSGCLNLCLSVKVHNAFFFPHRPPWNLLPSLYQPFTWDSVSSTQCFFRDEVSFASVSPHMPFI